MTRSMKESGVQWIGEVPSEWVCNKIKLVTGIRSGEYISAEKYDEKGDFEVIGSNGKTGYTNSYNNTEEVITTGRVGTIGKVTIVGKSWITDNALILKTNEKILSKLMFYLLPNIDFNLISTGTAQPLITATSLKNEIITFPINIKEQQKIIDLLDGKTLQIESILQDTKQSIQELKKYKQSLIIETVTKGVNKNVKMMDSGIEWIGDMPEHWHLVKTKRLFYIKKNIANEEGHPILSVTQHGLKIKDISKNEGQIATNYSKYQFVNIGDFVMNHMDLLTGWVDNSEFEGVTSPDYRVFRLIDSKNYLNDYYKYIFQACYSNKIYYGLGQGVSNLGRWRLQTDKFLNFELPSPTLAEQKEIVITLNEKCSHIDSLVQEKQQLLIELDNYKKALIYEYVTGKKEVL